MSLDVQSIQRRFEAGSRAMPTDRASFSAAFDDWKPLGLPADPWARHLLVALSRHVRRQDWVCKIIRERLGGDLAAIGRDQVQAHPEPSRGRVPGEKKWDFWFHGRGCCFTHDDGTKIDVDFPGGATDHIDWHFFGVYLATLAEPPFIERRLIRQKHLADHWMAHWQALAEAKLLSSGLTPSPLGRALSDVLEPVFEEIHATKSARSRAWLAVLIGDLPYAVEQLRDDAPESVREAYEELVAAKVRELEARARLQPKNRFVRIALEDIGASSPLTPDRVIT